MQPTSFITLDLHSTEVGEWPSLATRCLPDTELDVQAIITRQTEWCVGVKRQKGSNTYTRKIPECTFEVSM